MTRFAEKYPTLFPRIAERLEAAMSASAPVTTQFGGICGERQPGCYLSAYLDGVVASSLRCRSPVAAGRAAWSHLLLFLVLQVPLEVSLYPRASALGKHRARSSLGR